MTKPPVLKFSRIDPLQDYFEDRDGNRYDVARLVDASKDLPVFDLPLAGLDLDGCYVWRDATLHEAAGHLRRVMKADLSFPILLSWTGSIIDGRHRIVKALMQGKRTIKVRRMTWRPEQSSTHQNDK
ncbi:hypothetical protein [Castellaniella denitrificans]|uniref:ParB/Sulfiredoxin domain-containing protein n=1 Tax=Castellaniella denitrificans TaxID=56119 RepID=A0ABT4M6Q1_9BURK|nr:hypothetical protein [Castellaniella denitrificans]MCZ4330764.1 hypothetical protein [Castellaniella denitrificans]